MQEMMKEMISNDMIAAMQKMMEGVSSKIVEASEGAMQILEEHIQVMIDKKDEDDLAHKQRFETMTKELRALQSDVISIFIIYRPETYPKSFAFKPPPPPQKKKTGLFEGI